LAEPTTQADRISPWWPRHDSRDDRRLLGPGVLQLWDSLGNGYWHARRLAFLMSGLGASTPAALERLSS
jgi:hypothetical protein